jgi:hypothetical protein
VSIPIIRYARSLTAYLLTVAAVAGLFAVPTAVRAYDRAVRGVRVGQRLEFGHDCPTRFDDHRHVSPDELRQGSAVLAAVAPQTDAYYDTSDTASQHAVSAILARALIFHHDTFVKRVAPPGGPHTPRLAPLAPVAGRAPPSVS